MAADISVATYNLLAPAWTGTYYPYVRAQHLAWSYRGPLIQQRLIRHQYDVYCLQEVEYGAFVVFKSVLGEHGYKGFFYSPLSKSNQNKTVGMAIFYNTRRFEETGVGVISRSFGALKDTASVKESTKGYMAVHLTERQRSGAGHQSPRSVVVATTHLSGDPALAMTVQPREIAALLEDMHKMFRRTPAIVTGDFNADPTSYTYKVITHPPNGNYLSAYATHLGRDPDMTFRTDKIVRCVDYLFYRNKRMQVVDAIGLPSRAVQGPMPDRDQPSDHMLLGAQFKFLY